MAAFFCVSQLKIMYDVHPNVHRYLVVPVKQVRMSHNPPSPGVYLYSLPILLSCPFSGYNLTELPVQKVVLAVTSA